ncbi:hypothetical protein R5W24_001132 [Gemmata sp. JC717]|uniref:hypothetical protein n=1 Tax=Gemmata algarum TaxID=2975278 RepID=UPI0021BA858B|nr:hypothetical protein [Gemmata algarum]MDY3552052.1 hypothetical protein [Gemmata algarum]
MPGTPGNRAAVMTVGMLVIGLGLLIGGVRWYQNLHAAAVQRQRRATKRARALASARCCGLPIAVVYEGWHGSVHTFWFANTDFAAAFARANAAKVVRP